MRKSASGAKEEPSHVQDRNKNSSNNNDSNNNDSNSNIVHNTNNKNIHNWHVLISLISDIRCCSLASAWPQR